MSSPRIRRRGRPAFRCSSFATATTGATAPISPAPTRACPSRRCWSPSSLSSTTTSHRQGSCCSPTRSKAVGCLLRPCHCAPAARSACRYRNAVRNASSSTHALTNAREALARRLAESSSQSAIFARLGELFELDETPERVEVFDNSHISGTNPVGAMIVAGPEGLHQEPIPEVQHATRGPCSRRRLRHDARDVDEALQQDRQGQPRGGRMGRA